MCDNEFDIKMRCTCPEGGMDCHGCGTEINWTIPNPMCAVGNIVSSHWPRLKASQSRMCVACEDRPVSWIKDTNDRSFL